MKKIQLLMKVYQQAQGWTCPCSLEYIHCTHSRRVINKSYLIHGINLSAIDRTVDIC